MSEPYSVGNDTTKAGRYHSKYAVCKLSLPDTVFITCRISTLYVIHGFNKVIDLNRNDHRQIWYDHRESIDHVLDAVDWIGNIKSDITEIHVGPSQTKRIHDASNDRHYKRRDLFRESIHTEYAKHSNDHNRKSQDRVLKNIKYTFCCHPDESDSRNRTKQSSSRYPLLHPWSHNTADKFNHSTQETGRHRRRPCHHRVFYRIAKGHDHTVQHNEHRCCRNSGRQRSYIRSLISFGDPVTHPCIVAAAQKQSDGHARNDIAENHFIRPFQNTAQCSDHDQIVNDIIGNKVCEASDIASLKKWNYSHMTIH